MKMNTRYMPYEAFKMLCTKFSVVIYTLFITSFQIYEFYFKRTAQYRKYYDLNKQYSVYQNIILYNYIDLLFFFDNFLHY